MFIIFTILILLVVSKIDLSNFINVSINNFISIYQLVVKKLIVHSNV